MNYFRSLDGLRALAVTSVLLYHFGYLDQSFEIGWIGVQIFFVLSGYLITSILLDSKQASPTVWRFLGRFYWRRSLRIFPLYFSYLFGVCGIYFLFRTPAHLPDILPFLLSYTYNYAAWWQGVTFDSFFVHFWSLAVEEQFYMVWPLVVFWMPRWLLQRLVVLLILLGPVFRSLVYQYLVGTHDAGTAGLLLYWASSSHIDAFATGACIPLWGLDRRQGGQGAWFWSGWTVVLLAGLINLFLAEVPVSSLGYPIGGIQHGQHIWSYSLLNFLSLGMILYSVSSKSNWFQKAMGASLPVWIGKISYGMYVYHWVILAAYKVLASKWGIPSPIGFVIYYAVVAFVSWISFTFFESKILLLKDRLFSEKK